MQAGTGIGVGRGVPVGGLRVKDRLADHRCGSNRSIAPSKNVHRQLNPNNEVFSCPAATARVPSTKGKVIA